ncbi:MAG: sulfotransferase domain-containing protein [Saprospiraceae bacterium]|nr:sulfotransferase domain-containing protein [Saprospiraceae bacterium]
MLIWLASFPRSGNTFARNVLYQVYGLESTEVNEESLKFTSTYEEYAVVKTHLRPGQIPLDQSNCPVICLVRDGRDSLVSIAHHRTNIVAPGSDFLQNLEEATHAEKGSYFGGWGVNVYEWIQKAQVVIRFEDLILDPVGQLERLRTFIDLPKPDRNNLPTFSSQKFGTPKYGPQRGRMTCFSERGNQTDGRTKCPSIWKSYSGKKMGMSWNFWAIKDQVNACLFRMQVYF